LVQAALAASVGPLVIMEYKVIHLHLAQPRQQRGVDMVELILQMLVDLVVLVGEEVDLVVDLDHQLLDKEILAEQVLLVLGLALAVVVVLVV
jgi:hypothetical protein